MVSSSPPNGTNFSETIGVCAQGTAYTGELCKAELASLQECFSGTASPLTIPSSLDQQEGETNISRLAVGLGFLSPSPECERRIRPFLCLHVFGLCGSDTAHHTTTRQMCTELRDDLCVTEWSTAVGFLGAGVLPVCENLPDIEEDCMSTSLIGIYTYIIMNVAETKTPITDEC